MTRCQAGPLATSCPVYNRCLPSSSHTLASRARISSNCFAVTRHFPPASMRVASRVGIPRGGVRLHKGPGAAWWVVGKGLATLEGMCGPLPGPSVSAGVEGAVLGSVDGERVASSNEVSPSDPHPQCHLMHTDRVPGHRPWSRSPLRSPCPWPWGFRIRGRQTPSRPSAFAVSSSPGLGAAASGHSRHLRGPVGRPCCGVYTCGAWSRPCWHPGGGWDSPPQAVLPVGGPVGGRALRHLGGGQWLGLPKGSRNKWRGHVSPEALGRFRGSLARSLLSAAWSRGCGPGSACRLHHDVVPRALSPN